MQVDQRHAEGLHATLGISLQNASVEFEHLVRPQKEALLRLLGGLRRTSLQLVQKTPSEEVVGSDLQAAPEVGDRV